MPEYQILLLPKDRYYAWVEAAKDYALKFAVGVTADPDSAGRYMTPQQTITVAGAPHAYPAQGDIQAWFRRNYPSIRVDYVACGSPAELKSALEARIAANDRYLQHGVEFKLLWPTDYPKINQSFGEHPELYRRFNLPGHEGVDIRAPRNANVYAGADGTVVRVDRYHGDPRRMPYGNSVRIQHRDGYQTIYAHLQQALVAVGDVVRAGQVVGLADATGNTSGDHVHLTLKRAGATAAGLTNYPRDIIDPTPFLVWPTEEATPESTPPAISYPWPPGFCLVGVHGRADGPLQAADYPPLPLARIEAIKLLSSAQPGDVDQLRATVAHVFIMVRLFAAFENRVVRPDEFASWVAYDMGQFYQRGVRYFEVHNEPNLRIEGWTSSWNDGREFGSWFLEVMNLLKQLYPQAQMGYPGLSPGDAIPGQRMNALDFLTGSDDACRAADWLGLHCYWVSEQEMNSPAGGLGYLEYRRRFPDKLLFVTEFSNPAPGTDKRTKGQQYVRYYQHLRSIPGMGAALSFVLSASGNFASETWREEDGTMSEIPAIVGARTDQLIGTPPVPPG